MTPSAGAVDVVYIAASADHARFTRICVASVRAFYPEIPVRLLPGGRLSRGLVRELRRHWNVDVEPLPPGDYGWGFVKLEPLFGPAGEQFLVLDSDTVLTGPILDALRDSTAPFLVDEETQSEADTKRLYYDWEGLRHVDSTARPPAFVFNSGQWFGRAGVLAREDFDQWIEWSMPRRLRHPQYLRNGDQGVLNYVLNKRASLDLRLVERRRIMLWPGHGMQGLTAQLLCDGAAPVFVVHWAGIKKTLLRNAAGADLLMFFESAYYHGLPWGKWRRISANCHHAWLQWKRFVGVRLSLAYRRWMPTSLLRHRP